MNEPPRNPYQSPLASGEDLSWQEASQYRFIPLKPHSQIFGIVLLCDITASILFGMVDAAAIMMFPNINDFDSILTPTEELIALGILGIACIAMIINLLTIVLACVFIYRANANLRSQDIKDLSYSPAWSVGWWFVPIMQLFKPYSCVKEIYISSFSNAHSGEFTTSNPGRYILQFWWACWIFYYFVSLIGTLPIFYKFDNTTLLILTAFSELLYLLAGLCFMKIVTQIAAWQDRPTEV